MYVKRFSIALLLICFLLTSCGYDNSSIYVVCREVGDVKYCYNDKGEFFTYGPDSVLKRCLPGDLQTYPALSIHPTVGDYKVFYRLPGLYTCTLESLNNYLGVLSKECTFRFISRDWYGAELYADSEDYSIRLIFNLHGELRAYAIDNFDNPITPPYLIVD